MSDIRNFESAMERVGAAMLFAALLGGCSTSDPRGYFLDGRYCFKHLRQQVCTEDRIPTAEQETKLKRFPAEHGRLTLWVVRNAYLDVTGKVPLRVNGDRFDSLPYTFSHILLSPGKHTITLGEIVGGASLQVEGKAGEQVFVEIVADVGLFWKGYYLQRVQNEDGKSKALHGRLIKDVSSVSMQ